MAFTFLTSCSLQGYFRVENVSGLNSLDVMRRLSTISLTERRFTLDNSSYFIAIQGTTAFMLPLIMITSPFPLIFIHFIDNPRLESLGPRLLNIVNSAIESSDAGASVAITRNSALCIRMKGRWGLRADSIVNFPAAAVSLS
jgi:hypothetical protein